MLLDGEDEGDCCGYWAVWPLSILFSSAADPILGVVGVFGAVFSVGSTEDKGSSADDKGTPLFIVESLSEEGGGGGGILSIGEDER